MTAASDFNVGSNAFFLLFPIWLVIAGTLSRYRFQVLGSVLVSLTSVWYHLCWSHEKGYCAGDWSESSKDVWLGRDVLSSHFGILLTTSVLVDQLWFKHNPNGKRFMDALVVGGGLATFFLVWFLNDSPATTVLLAFMNCLVLGFALYYEIKRRTHSWWWFFRGGLAFCMILIASILKIVANTHEYSYYTTSQTEAYNLQHAFWHTLTGVGQFLLATLLDDLVYSAFGWTPTKGANYSGLPAQKV